MSRECSIAGCQNQAVYNVVLNPNGAATVGRLCEECYEIEAEQGNIKDIDYAERDDRVAALIDMGCSPAEAVDYVMVIKRGISQTEWAKRRNRSQQAVSQNIQRAKKKL